MQASSARKSRLALQRTIAFCMLTLLACTSPAAYAQVETHGENAAPTGRNNSSPGSNTAPAGSANGQTGSTNGQTQPSNTSDGSGGRKPAIEGSPLPPIRLPQNEPLNTQPEDTSGAPELERLYNTTRGAAKAEQGKSARPGAPLFLPGRTTAPTPLIQPPTANPTPSTTAPPPSATHGEGGPNAPPSGPDITASNRPLLSGYLSINQVLNQALILSPRAAAIRAQLRIQAALYPAATIMPDPQLFRDEAAISEQVLRIGPQMTWDPPWKMAFRLLAARRQVQEQKLEFLNSLWSFRNQVRGAYLEVVMAQETYDALALLATLSDRLWHISERLYKAGSVAGLDVLKAELAAHQSEVDRDQGAGRVALAKQQLNIIIGRGQDLAIDIPRLPQFRAKAERTGLMPNLNKEIPPANEFLEIALSNRLELRILAAQIRVANAQLRNAFGNIIPDPQLVTGYSANGNGPSGPKIKAFFTTMNYELPFFTYGQGDIPRLKATIRQYQSQIISQRNQINADVSHAYNHLINARKKILVYQDHILAESDRVAQLARRSYEVGQSDITSTLAAQQANVQVKQNYLDAVNAYQQAFTELEQAVGTPLI
ncbi:MAG TPA: TolC family protein [Candidatus Obscuribacterales bacterium]